MTANALPGSCIAILSIVAFATPLAAQDYPLSPIQMPSALDFNAMSQIGVVYDIEHDDEQGDSPAADRPETVMVNTGFRPSKARTKSNLASFVANARKQNPAAADELQRLFASSDVIAGVGQAMQTVRLDPANVADAYALWWISVWLAANERVDTPNQQTFTAVQQQARATFSNAKGMTDFSDGDRQQFAETLMIQSMIINSALERAKSDPAMMAQISQQAGEGAQSAGLDLSSMTLTDDGFRPREGAASEPASSPPALARTDAAARIRAANNTDTPLTTYAALAAAAGAGLGAVFLAGKAMGRRG